MDAGLIAMRMRLSGGPEVAKEAGVATTAVEETSAATEAANKKAQGLGNGIRSSLTKQITAMRTIGRSLTRYVSVPLAAIAIGSGVMAAHFDRSMNLVATDAGGSVKEVGRLKGQVLDLAKHSQFGPQKLADSLFHVESSGYRGAKAMLVLNEAQKLATTGNSDLEKTTYGLVSATKALYGDSLKNVNRTAAEMNGIVAHGDLRLEELVSAMATGVIPKAKAMGLNLRDVGAAMDIMTRRGIPAQRAAYALGFTMQKLIPYGKKAEEAFESIGLGQETLLKRSQGGKFGYVSGLELLQKHLDRLPTKGQQTKVIEEMFGGGRMTSGLLTDLQNLGEMRKVYGELGDEVGKYNRHVKEAEEQPMVKAQRAWSGIQASLIEVGQVLLPAAIPPMEHFASFVTGIATGFAALPPSTQHTIVGIAGIAAVLGPVLLLTAKLLEMWKSIKELSMVSALTSGMTKGRLAVGAAGLVGSQVAGNAIGGRAGELVSNIGGGASAGFMVGGPLGAAVGGTAGAVATALPEWEALLGLQTKLKPVQLRLAGAGRDVATATRKQAEASHGLNAADQRVTNSKKRQRSAVADASKALFHLNLVTAQYGPHSHAAIRAAAQYTQKLRAQRLAIEHVQHAERLRGIALRAYKTETNFKVLAERHEINLLQAHASELRKLYQREAELHPSSEKTRNLAHSLLNTEGELAKEIKRRAETISEATAKGGAAYGKFVARAKQETLRFGGVFKETTAHIQSMGNALERLAEIEAKHPEPRSRSPLLEPHHRHGKGGPKHSPRPKTTPATAGSSALERLLTPRKPRTVEKPVQFVVGKRVLAEGTVEIQEDEDARR